MRSNKLEQLVELAKEKGILRARDLDDYDLPRKYLSRLVDRGDLVRIGHGLYHHVSHAVTPDHLLAVSARRVPHGVVCLLSALHFHGLTQQDPFEVWLAIGSNDRRPSTEELELSIVRMNGESRAAGVECHVIEKVPIRMFNASKTVADCFKYRRRIGLGVAIDALSVFYRKEGGAVDKLWEYAKLCRVRTVIEPHLEALAAEGPAQPWSDPFLDLDP